MSMSRPKIKMIQSFINQFILKNCGKKNSAILLTKKILPTMGLYQNNGPIYFLRTLDQYEKLSKANDEIFQKT